MNLRVQGITQLSRGAGKFNDPLAFADSRHAEAMRGQPAYGDLHVGICRPKLTAELFRRDPLVIAGIPWRVHRPEKLLQSGFALRRAVQDQQHSLRRERIRHGALIVLCLGKRMDGAVERYELRLVDGLRNESRWRILCARHIPEAQAKNQGARHCDQRERAGGALHGDHLNTGLLHLEDTRAVCTRGTPATPYISAGSYTITVQSSQEAVN